MVLEAPVAVDLAVIVDKHSRVKPQVAVGQLGRLLAPVAHYKRAVGTRCLGYHALATFALVVGIKIVGLVALLVDYLGYVGGIKDVAYSLGIERFPVGVGFRLEYDAVISPFVEIVNRCRPHYLLAAAVLLYQ